MKPKDDLFYLIASMTKAEKRYFKLRVQQYTGAGANNNLLLFKVIEKMNVYEESAVKKALKRHAIAKNLSAAKYQLYRLILQCLNDYRAGKSLSIQLSDQIHNIGTLRQRGLYDQAFRVLQKAKVMAEKNERFLKLFELLALERSLLENSASRAIVESLLAVAEQEEFVSRQIANQSAYDRLRARVIAVRKKNTSARTELESAELCDVLQSPLLQDERQALSFRARLSFHRIKAEVALVERRSSDAIDAFQRLIELWDQRPDYVQFEKRRYHADLINFLNASLITAKVDLTDTLLHKVRSIKLDLPDDEVKTFQDLAHIELLYCLERGLFERGYGVVADIERGLERYEGKLSIARSIVLYYNIGLFYFFDGEFTKALHWMNAIQQHPNTGLRRDLRNLARLFLPVLHYELGNVDILDSLLRTAQRHLARDDAIHEFERLIITRMNKIIACVPIERKWLYAELHTELTALLNRTPEMPAPALTEIMYWVESKLEDTTLKTVLLRKIAEVKEAIEQN